MACGDGGPAENLGCRGKVPAVPVGYLVTVTIAAWCTLFALAPPRPGRSGPSNLSFRLGYLVNELPFVAFAWLLAATLLAFGQGDIDSPGGWVAVGVAAVTTGGLVVVARRGLRAGPAVDHAMSADLQRHDGGSGEYVGELCTLWVAGTRIRAVSRDSVASADAVRVLVAGPSARPRSSPPARR
jgi:hypothetical protein